MPDAATSPLPALPYDEWEATKATLHLVCQILGKVKLARHPKQNHWWHITLHVTPRGRRGVPDRGTHCGKVL